MNNFELIKRYHQEPSQEEKQLYEDNNLHYYSGKEEIANTLSHGVGIIFSIIGLILMLLKANSPAQYATAVLLPLGFLFLYTSSTIYHACTNLKMKSILRRIDYCSVNFIVIACGTGIALLTGKTSGFIIYGVCLLLSVASIIMTVVNFKKLRMVNFSMNFVIGAILFAAYFITDIEMSWTSIGINLAGIAVILVGAVLFGIKKPYVHFAFHLATLFGPILFWTANYLMLG